VVNHELGVKVERYGAGEEATNFVPGDFILAHRHHLIAGLISLAQKRRFGGADAVYAHWSHSAVIVEKDNAPRWDPPTLEGVTEAMLDGIFAALPSEDEWTPLP